MAHSQQRKEFLDDLSLLIVVARKRILPAIQDRP